MLLSSGHEVHLYGVGYCEIKHPNLTFHPVVTMQELRDTYGDGFDNELGYDWTKGFREDFKTKRNPLTHKFMDKAIELLPDKGFLLCAMGGNSPILKRTTMTVIEPGIGYFSSFAPYRAFESHSLQNFTYGKEHPKNDYHLNKNDRVIPNYFDLNDYEFNDKPQDYFLYMGRLIKNKGYLTALRVAQAYNKPLYVAGQGDPTELLNYPKSRYLGVVSGEDKKYLLKNAALTLVPSLYLEPFGGVAVESMLSGTPVISSDWGVFPETVINGVSGYRANTTREFVDLVPKTLELNRKKVREWAEQFSMENVNLVYEKWWKHIKTVSEIKPWFSV